MTETQEQIEVRRATDAKRKRESRSRQREEKQRAAVEKKAGEATSFEEYWQQQRTKLTVDERAQFEQRESDVLDLKWLMNHFLSGTYEQVCRDRNFTTDECVTLSELID